MTKIAKTLALGMEYHQAGDLSRAEEAYCQILKTDPDHADALHLLGVVAYQAGRHAAAARHIELAIAQRPGQARFHTHLGLVYQAQGRMDEALSQQRRAVSLDPGWAEAHNNLGTVLAALGRARQAAACYAEALQLQPDFGKAQYNLANAYADLGQLDDAVAAYREAVHLLPNSADVHNNLGNALWQQNRKEEAAACYREALRLAPDFAMAHHNLGKALLALGELEEAATHLRRAVELNPKHAGGHSGLGEVLQRQGKLEEAIARFRRALDLDPDDVAVRNALGAALADSGNLPEARACYTEVLRRRPDFGPTHFNLGNLLRDEGKLDEAVASYRQALRLMPTSPDVHTNLGHVLSRQQKPDEAIQCFEEAVRHDPTFASAHFNLGNCRREQGKLEEAAASYRQAIAHRPEFTEAHFWLGRVLLLQGNNDDAIASFRRALEINADLVDAHNNLGTAYFAKGNYEEAAACFRQAIRVQPDYALAHANLATTYFDLGRVEDAVASYERALALDPTDKLRITQATLLRPVYQTREELHFWRQRFEENVARLVADGVSVDITNDQGMVLFYLAYHGEDDCELMRQAARLYRLAPEARAPLAPAKPRTGKIKIGFISAHLKNHTIGHLNRGLIKELSRDLFDVTVFAAGRHQDFMVDLIRQHADHYLEVPSEMPAARRCIAEQEMDILFYTDIGMDTQTYTLAFSRLAPVQCVTWGHPLTTGIDTMDYFISSEALETEGADKYYTETLVRLKHLAVYYYRPEAPAVEEKKSFGLPNTAHLYSCPQSIFKLHPEFDDILRGILQRDPNGLLVFVRGKHPHWDDMLLTRFCATMPDVADRVRFVPPQSRSRFMSLMALSEVLLDPIHFGGGNTTYEAFSMDVPVVTLPSRFLRGRITWALYDQMGVRDCLAASPEEYVDLAVRLGTDKEYRAAISAKIKAAKPVLYENPAGVRELEEFLQEAITKERSTG
jgi:predicted O-linked N-acetylglucosamine transferase (SPINDLY family)